MAIAITNRHESIVKLILDESNYDLCSDISPKTADTCIHAACRVASDISLLQSLFFARSDYQPPAEPVIF